MRHCRKCRSSCARGKCTGWWWKDNFFFLIAILTHFFLQAAAYAVGYLSTKKNLLEYLGEVKIFPFLIFLFLFSILFWNDCRESVIRTLIFLSTDKPNNNGEEGERFQAPCALISVSNSLNIFYQSFLSQVSLPFSIDFFHKASPFAQINSNFIFQSSKNLFFPSSHHFPCKKSHIIFASVFVGCLFVDSYPGNRGP